MPVLNIAALIQERIAAVKDYHNRAGIQRAELDVSGGIDSAVMLLLLARALGPDQITAVYSHIDSSDQSRRRAQAVARACGAALCEVEATAAYRALADAALASLGVAGYDIQNVRAQMSTDPTIAGSLRSCLRAPLGRFMNRLTGGGIRHGTGNEDEDRWLRFYQKGGDGEVDTNPLAMLSKGEVYQLAVGLGCPAELITCTPTPDLWADGENHTDEDELHKLSGVPWSYSRVDPDTGKYTRVGTIERMSRLLDSSVGREPGQAVQNIVFGDEDDMSSLSDAAAAFDLSLEHLASARKWERSTRHKQNPNCPSLGSRTTLLAAGIITDELPDAQDTRL